MRINPNHAGLAATLLACSLASYGQTQPCPAARSNGATARWQDELRCVKTLRVEVGSRFFNADALIRELLKSKDFQDLGYQAVKHTSDPSRRRTPGSAVLPSELLLRVTRKKFTTRFTVSLVSPATDRIYVSDQASSLGGEIEPDLAKIILRWIREANGESAEKKSGQ
jgi:hypothetical protein